MSLSNKDDSRMSAATFMAWYESQPEGKRYELFDGQIYEMQRQLAPHGQAERAAHGEVKMRVAETFRRQIRERNLPCQGFGDGMAVQADAESVFEPDAQVRCGPRLPGNTTLVRDPMIVVEVLSPGTQHVDSHRKFSRYFRNPAIIHYLIVNIVDRNAVHHRRVGDKIESSTHDAGVLAFDPPGLTLDLAGLFVDLD